MREFAAALITLSVLLPVRAVSQADSAHPEFVGSETCRKCHEAIYEGWKQTRMANVVRDQEMKMGVKCCLKLVPCETDGS